MTCMYCELIKNSRFPFLYEDEYVAAFLTPVPHAAGHIVVCPKAHIPIFEEVPDNIIGRVFEVANKVGIALLKSINAKGNNIIVQNGLGAGQDVPHFSVNIIPRRNDDGYNFDWTPIQLDDEQMTAIQAQIKNEIDGSSGEKTETKKKEIVKKEGKEGRGEREEGRTEKEDNKRQYKSKEDKKEEEKESGEDSDGKESYLFKQLKRIP